MNNFQISTQTSNKLIVTEAKNNLQVLALIPSFAKGITRLEEITNEIDSLDVQQSKDLKGITEDKQVLKEELADYVIDVAGAVHSFANGKSNKTLQTKVNFKTNKVHSLNQNDLTNAAAVVLEEAGKIPAETLAEEGITAEEMTQFAETFKLFSGTTTGKREAVIERSSTTDRIAELFAEAADLKKNTLDRLVTQYQRKAPEFYNKYKAAANVIHKRAAKANTTPPAGKV